jgi:hypothetical protein
MFDEEISLSQEDNSTHKISWYSEMEQMDISVHNHREQQVSISEVLILEQISSLSWLMGSYE